MYTTVRSFMLHYHGCALLINNDLLIISSACVTLNAEKYIEIYYEIYSKNVLLSLARHYVVIVYYEIIPPLREINKMNYKDRSVHVGYMYI